MSDSSFGIWPAATNLIPNGGGETNTNGITNNQLFDIARQTSEFKFGSAAIKSTFQTPTLTKSGDVITDTTRLVTTSGDGLSNDSSYGIWAATTNLVSNGGAETDTTGCTAAYSTVTRDTTTYKFGTACFKVVIA